MSTYLWIDLGTILLPFLFSFHPRLRFHRHWGALGSGIIAMALVFIPWDIRFTASGLWGFSPTHLIGVRWLGLPVEEWLFFLCIPYACVFTYHSIGVLWPQAAPGPRTTRTLAIALIGLVLVTALANTHRAYAATTGFLLAGWLAFVVFVLRAPWLGRFLLAYAVLLVPFTVVNGLLTGMGLERPVVWYDATAILGPRLGTIPVEDVFYGLLMVGMTVTVYEAVDARAHRTTDR
ncbi:MAG: lycopene cyclase domain-containing protein [Bacteroidetes bacterium]|nr:lycopene cyclase domain-containing protein [Bacteroidota bacterium]